MYVDAAFPFSRRKFSTRSIFYAKDFIGVISACNGSGHRDGAEHRHRNAKYRDGNTDHQPEYDYNQSDNNNYESEYHHQHNPRNHKYAPGHNQHFTGSQFNCSAIHWIAIGHSGNARSSWERRKRNWWSAGPNYFDGGWTL